MVSGFAPFLSYINLLLLILWMKIIFVFVCNLSEKLKLLVFGFLHFAAELFCELRREEKRRDKNVKEDGLATSIPSTTLLRYPKPISSPLLSFLFYTLFCCFWFIPTKKKKKKLQPIKLKYFIITSNFFVQNCSNYY